ncbi:uncharacterized protein LOC126771737 isoform X2 [Nymphalis io]|uniref:uncharacterized protein LOC126771737 isoform X2 n=1 Tax=Inachis io TaxID=171585 RepID=UPI00216724EC|nr:uncharacterized protein LOC126771737 isoform X2 [Nymphalis io]
MSAPSDSATSPSPCACTNISLMQLFHELKQKFPGVPDHVVSNTIELYCHDKKACETHLHKEVKASLTHAYHASSSAAARQLNELRVNPPIKCRNQPIIKHEAAKCTAIKSLTCQGPQNAVISTNSEAEEEKPFKLNTDANQNVVENNIDEQINNISSPVTIINIDNCYAKYNAESPSDLELTNDNKADKQSTFQESKLLEQVTDYEQPESTNYKILKSSKIKANLNERLETSKEVKEKKTIKKELPVNPPQEKPQRPNTLNFIKPNPDIAFKDNLKQPEPESCRTVSPAPSTQKTENKEQKSGNYRLDRGYPLNWSVNVNCHMDLSRAYPDGDYDSPRAITSVNLTVCTPTSNMASPVRDTREEDGAFEGHVTVTVSPSTTRPPRRRAPPPPMQKSRLESPRPTRAAPEPPGLSHDRSLIDRQKERLSRLASAVAQEKGRLAQLNRETQILAAPPPTPSAAQRLKDYVERLRDECDTLAKRLEMDGHEADDTSNFYSNIYTGQRQPTSWQCHMCTFRNHPLLDKCEECDMPRIFVGTSPATTHDSGFGSFRDRNRRGANRHATDVADAPISHVVGDYRAVNV